MKKMKIIINSEKSEDLKTILEPFDANGLMINNLMNYSNRKDHKQMYRGMEYTVIFCLRP